MGAIDETGICSHPGSRATTSRVGRSHQSTAARSPTNTPH